MNKGEGERDLFSTENINMQEARDHLIHFSSPTQDCR